MAANRRADERRGGVRSVRQLDTELLLKACLILPSWNLVFAPTPDHCGETWQYLYLDFSSPRDSESSLSRTVFSNSISSDVTFSAAGGSDVATEYLMSFVTHVGGYVVVDDHESSNSSSTTNS